MTRWTSFQRVYLHVEKHMRRHLVKKKTKNKKQESNFSCRAIDRITTFCVVFLIAQHTKQHWPKLNGSTLMSEEMWQQAQ